MAAVNPCSRSLANGDISQLGSPAEPAIFIVSDSSSSSMPEDVGPGANFEPSAPSTVQLGFAAVAPGPPYPITPIPIQATGTFGNDGALPSSSFPTPSIQPQNAPVMDAGMQPGDAYAPSEHYMVPVEEAAVPLSSHPVFPPFAAAPEAQSSSWTIPQSAPYHEMLHEEDDDDMELVCTIDPHDNGQIHPGVSLNGIAVEAGIQYPQAITSQLTLPYINTDGSFPTIVFVDDPQVPIAPIAATTNPMPHLDPGVSMDFQTPQSFPDAGPAFSTGSLRNALPEVITAHSSATSTMQFIVTDDTGIGPAAQKSSRISADPFPPANNETSTSSSQMPHSPLRGTEVKDQQTDLASFLGSSAHPNASPTSVEHGTEVPGAGSCRPEIPTADDLRSSQDATPATTTSATECATALPYACYSVASPSKGDDINGATSDLFPSIVAPDEAVSTCLPPTTEEPPAVPVAPPRTPTSNEGCATTSCPVSDDVTAQQPIISKSATPAKPARGKRRGSPPRSGPSRIECVNGSFAAASSSASTTVPEENGEARQHTSSNTATSSFEEAQPEAAPASPPAVSATEPIAGSTPQPTPSVPPEAPEAHFSKSQPDGKPAASRVEPFHDDEFTIDVLEAYVMMEYQYCHKRTIEKRGKPGRTDPLLWMAKACALQRRIRAIQNNALRNGVAKDEVVAGLKQSSGGAGMAWRLSRVFLGLPDEPKLTRIEGAMHDDPCIPGVEEYPDILALMSLSLHDGVYDPDRVPK
ncbi:hypothetical protein PsYK624_011880 [Phanerochaete sordida]|uniref:Uncharacterized protein n=1 Tax=Phanerochaete sordida TaxID=48140 RepID=A0A9P3FYW9_9APHY|nr:hypothetical protein PsYK624_011880 [Phanerochaete sordida]